MTEELDRLKAKAEGMGLIWHYVRIAAINIVVAKGESSSDDDEVATAAESLLALRDPKAVRVVDFIEAEPEFPDEMPDELLNTFRETVGCDIRKGMAELICRVIVKVTKEAIIKRLPKAPDGEEWVLVKRRKVE